jgi:hypothetical protein
VANIFDHLRPGAAVAAAGWKRPPAWLWPLRARSAAVYGGVVTDFTNFARPWRPLLDRVPDLQVMQLGFGTGYVAHGHMAMDWVVPVWRSMVGR